MIENLKIWDALKTPPLEALSKISGGRLNNMTDIKPQWRYKAMTEQFGPVGFGWNYTILKEWIENGADGNICAFVNIELVYKQEGEWSQPIPGTGGASFVAKERSGLHTSDECFKMATTDALSVAMKMIGVGASVYEGNVTHESKYSHPQDSGTQSNSKPSDLQKFTAAIKACKSGEEVSRTSKAWADAIGKWTDNDKAEARKTVQHRKDEFNAG